MMISTKAEELGPWYHRVPLPDGSTTPGKIDTEAKFQLFAHSLPSNLEDFTVLDLGCSSGGLALQYALRGARVTGIDSKLREVNQSRYVFELHGLKGNFFQDDVMNAWRYGQFDIINACGLLYHLPYPMLFLDLLSRICRKQLILATRISPEQNNTMDLMRLESHGNWWFPTEKCVLQMMALAGFTGTEVISVNGDRSNLFCSADASNKQKLKSTENPFEMLISERSPTGERLVGASEANDLPT